MLSHLFSHMLLKTIYLWEFNQNEDAIKSRYEDNKKKKNIVFLKEKEQSVLQLLQDGQNDAKFRLIYKQ